MNANSNSNSSINQAHSLTSESLPFALRFQVLEMAKAHAMDAFYVSKDINQSLINNAEGYVSKGGKLWSEDDQRHLSEIEEVLRVSLIDSDKTGSLANNVKDVAEHISKVEGWLQTIRKLTLLGSKNVAVDDIKVPTVEEIKRMANELYGFVTDKQAGTPQTSSHNKSSSWGVGGGNTVTSASPPRNP